MRNKKLAIAISCVALAAWLLRDEPESASVEMPSVESAPQSKAAPHPVAAKPSPTILTSSDKVAAQAPAPLVPYKSYFAKHLAHVPLAAKLHSSVRKSLPDNEASELIAIYVAEGPFRNDSPEFYQFMNSLEGALDANAEGVYDSIIANHEALKSDPFVFQMVLNLGANLSIDPQRKANLLALALEQPFEFDSNGEMTDSAGNITVALIQMRNSGVTSSMVRPQIERAIQLNKDDPKALRAFIVRAAVYYPDLFDPQ